MAIPTPDPSGWARLLAEAFDFAGPARQQARRGYDEDLADRIRELLGELVGVDRADAAKLLTKPHTHPMVMRGREMAGWIRVSEASVRTKRQLTPCVRRGVDHARSKQPKRRSR